MRAALALFVTWFAVAAHGAGVSVWPLGPTSATPIVVRTTITCPVTHQVDVVERDVLINLNPSARCPSVPLSQPYEVPIGTLPPGQYRIILSDRVTNTFATFTFIVRDANPIVSFHPWVVPAGLGGVRLRTEWHVPPGQFRFCSSGAECAVTTIKIGDVTIRPRDIEQNGGIIVPSPHRTGLADVVVTNARGTTIIPAALYFVGTEGSGIDLSVFERVLFPVLFGGAGANGSQWRSEAVISNPQSNPVFTGNGIAEIPNCLFLYCRQMLFERSDLVFNGEGYPQGVALLAPRDRADALAFSLRVRDVSREAEGFGTEVPVVREAEMFRNVAATLLDVPADPRYRTKLRMYAFPDPMYGEALAYAAVELRLRGGSTAAVHTIRLTRTCSGSTCPFTPMYGELDLDPRVAARYNIYVTAPEGALGWAFASVTNNATQQVTVVTPNGRGGKPAQ